MIVGRDEELAALERLVDGLDATGGKVVLIRGEAGIGKSALIGEFTAGQEQRAHILAGACDDLLIPQPHGPLWDIGRKEPSVAGALRTGERVGVFEAVLDLLMRSLRPTILVLEDTQWADEATLDVIKFVGRRIAQTNGLLVLSYRDGEVDVEHPLRRVIGELAPDAVERIHLGPLTREAVAALMDGEPFEAGEVLDLTGGNPLFVVEILRSGLGSVPHSVKDSVLAQAARLSPGARDVLDLVSVSPGATERSLVERIFAPTTGELAECVRLGLLEPKGEYLSFHHELARRAIESGLDEPNRRRLNGLVLNALKGRTDSARLVHHARRAEDANAIIEFAPKAARAAMDAGSHREALAHFRALEPYLDRIPVEERARVVDEWARSEYYLDNPESLDILQRAVDLYRAGGDDRALARALTFAVRVNEVNGRPAAADAASAEAMAILEAGPEGEDLAFAVAQRAWLAVMRGDISRALEEADRALAMAEPSGYELPSIHALNTKGFARAFRGEEEGFRLLEEARRRSEEAGFAFEETRALLNLLGAACDTRDLGRAAAFAQRARDTAARYELRVLEAYAKAYDAMILLWKGNWQEAEDTAGEIVPSHPHVEVPAGMVLGTLQARRGRSEAPATLERVWALAEGQSELQTLGPTAAACAESMWLVGRPESDRIDLFREVLERLVGQGFAWDAGSLSFWLWKLGALTAAPGGIAGPYRLMIDGDHAKAAAAWEQRGFPYERGLALMLGEDHDQVEALRVFEDLGAVALAGPLRSRLLKRGVKIPRGRARATKGHAAGLTPRQAEVLELLGQDLTNAEIADQLFLSPRTVEHHVAAVLSKLDVSSRTEAVQAAADLGLLTPA